GCAHAEPAAAHRREQPAHVPDALRRRARLVAARRPRPRRGARRGQRAPPACVDPDVGQLRRGAAVSVPANVGAQQPSGASRRSLLEDNRQIARAIEMIELGARLQMLQAETELPYERLLRLYKEVAGRSPSKGQLPFSTDWFVAWQPNIHASLFYNLYGYLLKTSPLDDVEAIIKAYRLYAAEIESLGVEPLLSITRAWRMVRFVDAG